MVRLSRRSAPCAPFLAFAPAVPAWLHLARRANLDALTQAEPSHNEDRDMRSIHLMPEFSA